MSNRLFIELAAGIAITQFLKRSSIEIFGRNQWTLRPAGFPSSCGSWDRDMGMPSGHSVMAGIMFAHYQSPLWLLVPMWRVYDRCHTAPQVILGFLLGILIKRCYSGNAS